MIVVFFIIIAWAIAYIILLSKIKTSWDNTSVPSNDLNVNSNTVPKVSVIVAARNEATHIESCLKSIISNKYHDSQGKPLYEVIVIDDHSTDATTQILARFIAQNHSHDNIKIYSLPDDLQGKKAAITYAISKAKHPIILCTDADCLVSDTWISDQVAALKETHSAAQTGLVYMKDDEKILTRFQMMDYLATMAITNHGYYTHHYHLANGANMCYFKSSFVEVEGYKGNEQISSGDDVFLIHKIAQVQPVSFLKNLNSIVYTLPEPTWSALWRQRKRWATKATVANNPKLTTFQGFIFLYCVIIVLAITLGLVCYPTLFFAGIIALSIKIGMDYLFLSSLALDFQSEEIMKSFPICFFIYFFHILSSGWFALTKGHYQWKDRTTK